MENPKVLVAAPTFYVMKYCLKEFLEGIKNLSYENKEILLVDNSKTNEFFEELKKENWITVLKDETKEELPAKRLISSRNKILEYALENNYDYIFMLDADVIPPRNTIEELLKPDKDINSGLYYNYFTTSGELKLLPVVWMPITESEFEEIKKKLRFPESVKSHKDLQRHMTKEEAESGELLEVMHPSAGCMLLSKKVFEKIRYDLLQTPGGLIATDDIYFIKKAKEEGFKVYCDTKIKCSHLLEGKFKKTADGNLLHPISPDYENL